MDIGSVGAERNKAVAATAIVGAGAVANLMLLGLDIIWDR
jgi:hypothetical protein